MRNNNKYWQTLFIMLLATCPNQWHYSKEIEQIVLISPMKAFSSFRKTSQNISKRLGIKCGHLKYIL